MSYFFGNCKFWFLDHVFSKIKIQIRCIKSGFSVEVSGRRVGILKKEQVSKSNLFECPKKQLSSLICFHFKVLDNIGQ